MPSDLDRGACRHKPSGQVPAYVLRGRGSSRTVTGITPTARGRSPPARRATCRPLRTMPAMAAKVTERLWEIGDIVDVLESWETARQRTA
jgi:hypothetical protein